MNRPEPTALASWLVDGERGISSDAIVARLTGVPAGRRSHPLCPSELRQCELLLRRVPAARMVFDRMRDESPEWAALVDHWDDLVEIMEEEFPDAFTNPGQSLWLSAVPRTYGVMRWLRITEAAQ